MVLAISGARAATNAAQRGHALARGSDIGGCPMLPADNVWNVPVDGLPLHERSADFVASVGRTQPLHPDFGSGTWQGGPIGIPYVVVPRDQALVPVSFMYADESDPGPYPVPPDAPVEGGAGSTGDRHVLVVRQGTCTLFELYAAYPQIDGSWSAGSGALFHLDSNALRPDTWTSADAAGLPILPGLVRYDEVAAGEIAHAIRVTAPRTRRAYVWPARHFASQATDPALPAMGQRFRLRADFDVEGGNYSPEVRVILRALKRFGLILADNGSPWFISGAPDERWDNDALHVLRTIRGSDFEAVETGSLMVSPDSGQARGKHGPTDEPAATPTATGTATVAGALDTSTPADRATATFASTETAAASPTSVPPAGARAYLPAAWSEARAGELDP